jgi:hypothetical protein
MLENMSLVIVKLSGEGLDAWQRTDLSESDPVRPQPALARMTLVAKTLGMA